MEGISKTTNGFKLLWDGPSGYYQVYQKTNLTSGTWKMVGGANMNRNATITTLYKNAFFRVAGPSPQYAGAQACEECHANIHKTEMDTRHAHALDLLKQVHQDTNPECLPCHTVGYGLPTGYKSETTTPLLAGVQCENCHGPAGNHAANPDDLTVKPRVEIAAQVCGGCHTDAHHPTFDEFQTSAHAIVTEENMNVNTCGRCHVGSARLAMIKKETVPTDDPNIGVTCVVCHDPHLNHIWTNVITRVVYTNQVRNPFTSTNDYFLSTADVFTNKYNPNINVCAQCHNHRGADWTTTSRPPHHSPQYNMLIATVGVLPDGVTGRPATHAGTRYVTNSLNQKLVVTNQCISCHMPQGDYVSETQPALTGHSFRVENYDSCEQCHSLPEFLVNFTAVSIAGQMQQVKNLLDTWALTKAPDVLRTNYGVLSWEYSIPGELSTGTNAPPSARQTFIPDNIKKARFNLYIVLHDGSYGVHNGPYAFTLLNAARDWVQTELNK